MRVFVCSPLRGKGGQPSQENIALARMLMRAVFNAGHQPFVPHLLYPQVLTENHDDLKKAFDANFAWLDVSEEIWVYARKLEGCSTGMKLEVERARRISGVEYHGVPLFRGPRVVWMPPPFEEIETTMNMDWLTPPSGLCSKCTAYAPLNRQGICLQCFAGGTPA